MGPPSAPTLLSPSNGATNVSTSPALSWNAATGATSYDVYLGTSNPPGLYSTNVTDTSLNVGPLTANTTYYWKVTAKNSVGSADSTLSSFTVAAILPAPILLTP